jgi:hypothetical protein
MAKLLHGTFLKRSDENVLFFDKIGLKLSVVGLVMIAEEAMDDAVHFLGLVSTETEGVLLDLYFLALRFG